jgi:hypothetical protein
MKTKMKNTVIIASFFLLSTISYGQTKEETISWLTEKFNKYLIGYNPWYEINNITISTCAITIDVTYDAVNDSPIKYRTVMPTDGINIWELGFQFNEERVSITDPSNKLRFSKNNDYCKLKNAEPDLYGRVKKALEHLATFCPKKKETF